MIGKREQDSILSTSDTSEDGAQAERVEGKLRSIISTVVKSVQQFVQGGPEVDSQGFKGELEQHLTRLKETSDVEELTDIEESLKKLVFQQWAKEKLHVQSQYEEIAKVVETLMAGIDEFTKDNISAGDEFSGQLSEIGLVAELDDLTQIREQIREGVEKSRAALEAKQERDSIRQKNLSEKVDTLEHQLRQVQEETLIDKLTKAHNRRAFDERLEEEIRRSRTTKRGFGLVLFDVDEFKKINDTHGHRIGDGLLAVLSSHAKESIRVDDFLARYGGEEFAALLFLPSVQSVWQVAERLRERIGQKKFRYQKGGKIHLVKFTVSGGVAWFGGEDTAESLIERADRCLRLAKQQGRNRMCVQEGSGER